MNAFRMTPDRSLDRVFLRTCAIYRLLKVGWIGQGEALEMQNRKWRKGGAPRGYLSDTIRIWKDGPLRGMRP